MCKKLKNKQELVTRRWWLVSSILQNQASYLENAWRYFGTQVFFTQKISRSNQEAKIQLCCVKYKLAVKLQSLVRRARGTQPSTENCWNHPQMYCNTIQILIFMVYSIAYWDLFLLLCLSCSCCAYKTENRDVKQNDV
jgi:hypothetical protein